MKETKAETTYYVPLYGNDGEVLSYQEITLHTRFFWARGMFVGDWNRVHNMYPEANIVAVNESGSVKAYAGLSPNALVSGWSANSSCSFLGTIGFVGEKCPDWRDLCFKYVKPQMLPDGFWDAVSILLGDEYEWFAFDDDEQPYVYVRRGDTWGSGLTKVRKLDLPKMDAGTDWGKTLTRRPFLRIGQTKEKL